MGSLAESTSTTFKDNILQSGTESNFKYFMCDKECVSAASSRGMWIEIRKICDRRMVRSRHAPRGARGLKLCTGTACQRCYASRPSRGAWVDDEQSKGAAKMAVWEQSKCDSEEQAFLIDGMTVEEFMKNCKNEYEAEEKNNDETSNTH